MVLISGLSLTCVSLQWLFKFYSLYDIPKMEAGMIEAFK